MKTAKNLLIPLVVMILLAIGVVVFFAIDRTSSTHETSTNSSVDLLYVNPVDVASVEVLHKEGGVNVKVDKNSTNSGSYVYAYSGSDKGPDDYSQSAMEGFLNSLTSFVGCTHIADKANLAEYGLDDPSFKVTINKKDGTSSSILIGNLSPDKSYCYICISGSSSVYYITSAKYDYASKVSNDFIDSSVMNLDVSELDTVRFVRKTDAVDLTASCIYDEQTGEASFKFTKPFTIESSPYFDRLIEKLCRLEAEEYEDADQANIAKYGLSDPAYSIVLSMKSGKTYTVNMSSAVKGYHYGRINGEGKIFKVSSDKLETIESPVLVLISSYVFYDTCDNVLSIECSGQGRKFVMKLDVAKNNTISDNDSTVELDGRNAKVFNSQGRSYAAMLFESIFCINIAGVEELSPVSSNAVPDTTITIFNRNHSSVVYDFYKRNDVTYYVYCNGVYTKFYVFGRELYNDGGENTYEYGIWSAYDLLTKAITNSINGAYDIPKKSE